MITDSFQNSSNHCRICTHPVREIFRKKILLKYKARYGLCPFCGFLQVENPLWLNEAYASAIASLDIGLVSRNLSMTNRLAPKFRKFSNNDSCYLDYGGGYGLFARMMRDKVLTITGRMIFVRIFLPVHLKSRTLTALRPLTLSLPLKCLNIC